MNKSTVSSPLTLAVVPLSGLSPRSRDALLDAFFFDTFCQIALCLGVADALSYGTYMKIVNPGFYGNEREPIFAKEMLQVRKHDGSTVLQQ